MQVTITEHSDFSFAQNGADILFEGDHYQFRFTDLTAEMYELARTRIIAKHQQMLDENYENMEYGAEDILTEHGFLDVGLSNGCVAIVEVNAIRSLHQNVINILVPVHDGFEDKMTFWTGALAPFKELFMPE